MNPCLHFQHFVCKYGLAVFAYFHQYFTYRRNMVPRKVPFFCHKCHTTGPHLFACLECPTFACNGLHIIEHLQICDHTIALEIAHGTLYCMSCSEFIYDMEVEHAVHDGFAGMRTLVRRPQVLCGLHNLGSTCYMNSILQALFHTPLLNAYFAQQAPLCTAPFLACNTPMACALSQLFKDMRSSNRVPVVPAGFAGRFYGFACHLAEKQEHDAHEFFMALMGILHEQGRPLLGYLQCHCIVDVLLGGSMQSNVACIGCGHVSTTTEMFWDLSLDLGQRPYRRSLETCLEAYIQTEDLGPCAKITCSSCKLKQQCAKKLTIAKMPTIACFHLKRFQRINGRNEKISHFVSFPLVMDMSPYLIGEEFSQGILNMYKLYAVITHSGDLVAGHYRAYVRCNNMWFCCNDLDITGVSTNEVLRSEGYILFYHRQGISEDGN